MSLGIELDNNKHYCIIKLKGSLLKNNVRILEEMLCGQLTKKNRLIAMDIDELQYIENSVAKNLLDCKRDAELLRIDLLIISSKLSHIRTLRECGLDKKFRITTLAALRDELFKKKRFPIPGLDLQFTVKL